MEAFSLSTQQITNVTQRCIHQALMQSQRCDDARDIELIEINGHKAVLLREHKRHTARHVASPGGGGGGGGHTYLGWGRVLNLARGYLPWLGGTYLGQGEGEPTLAGGGGTYLGLVGEGGTYLGWGGGGGTDLGWVGGRGTYLGWGQGEPNLARMGYPSSSGVDRLKT